MIGRALVFLGHGGAEAAKAWFFWATEAPRLQRQGARVSEFSSDVCDSQRGPAGVGELELAGIPRPQSDPAQIAHLLFKRNLRRNVLPLSACRSKNNADQDNSNEQRIAIHFKACQCSSQQYVYLHLIRPQSRKMHRRPLILPKPINNRFVWLIIRLSLALSNSVVVISNWPARRLLWL